MCWFHCSPLVLSWVEFGQECKARWFVNDSKPQNSFQSYCELCLITKTSSPKDHLHSYLQALKRHIHIKSKQKSIKLIKKDNKLAGKKTSYKKCEVENEQLKRKVLNIRWKTQWVRRSSFFQRICIKSTLIMGLAASAQLVESNDRQFIQPSIVKTSKFSAILFCSAQFTSTSLRYVKRTVNKNVRNFDFFFMMLMTSS